MLYETHCFHLFLFLLSWFRSNFSFPKRGKQSLHCLMYVQSSDEFHRHALGTFRKFALLLLSNIPRNHRHMQFLSPFGYNAFSASSWLQAVSLDITIFSLSGKGLNELGRESQVFLPITTALKPSSSVSLLNLDKSLEILQGRFPRFPIHPSSSIATIIEIFILPSLILILGPVYVGDVGNFQSLYMNNRNHR